MSVSQLAPVSSLDPAGSASRFLMLRTFPKQAAAAFSRRLFLDRQLGFWLDELGATWSPHQRRARVVDIIEETADTKSFVLRPGHRTPRHRAGQYLPIEVEIDGVRSRRCYSISSAPGASKLTITVKRIPGGKVSSFLHDHLEVGDLLGIGDPIGDFVLPEVTPKKLLFLSGGSGITPVMSMLRDLTRRGAITDVVFVHAARSAKDVIFANELAALDLTAPGARLAFHHDDAENGRRLDESALRAIVPDLDERETFLCGPSGMMDALAPIWTSRGIEQKLKRERFVSARPSVTAVSSLSEVTRAKVHLTVSQRDLTTDGRGSLLEQLERTGVNPASGCRMGICNTCRCRKVSGTVQDTITGAISSEPDEEIRLCVSVPQSDLEIAL